MEKTVQKKVPEKKSSKDASSGIQERLKEMKQVPTFEPNKTEKVVGKYIEKRMHEMQDFRRSLNLETRWKQADEEYVPHELDFGTTRKRFETDQDTGLRSRMVPVGDVSQQWRQASSAPVLLAKIQTAISIIIDQQPEADLVPLLKKYMATTDLAYALWKRNWQITNAKEKLKLFIFNLIKYGWAAQRTYPRNVTYDKRILVEKDPENPENDRYEESSIEWFNDVDREPLNPFRTWIDEMTVPYDPYSMNECYYEKDYSYDAFKVEFGKYPNSEFVPKDSALQRLEETSPDTNRQTVARSQSVTNQSKVRQDIVTVGFFESRHKDLYALYIPRHKIVLYNSPLPNDDGYLSLTQTMWILRSSNLPFGIALWDIIRQNKALYDKMKNMTMDQLVLSIMKFGFFSGTSTVLGDGIISIVPGQARQLTSSTGKPEVDWMEIPGPGEEAWKGLEAVGQMMDDDSGISAFLEGGDTPGQQTLGEMLHRKEAGLKRIKVPLENIAWAIEQDAYLTLSWMSQVYSIPVMKDFVDEAELMEYEKEEEIQHNELFQTKDGGLRASYYPQLSLHLEDRDGKLKKSKQSQFMQIGSKQGMINPKQLKWRGIFKIIPRSIIDSSQTLAKASKMEMSNMLAPLFVQDPQLVAKLGEQIVKIHEEDPKDWLPDSWIAYLDQANNPKAPGTQQPGAPVPPGGAPAPATPGAGNTMQNKAGMTAPSAPTVVPNGQVSAPTPAQTGAGSAGNIFTKRL